MATSHRQLIDQTTRHAVYLERYKSSAIKEYNSLLKKMRKAIISELDGEITEWSRTRLEKQLVAIRRLMREMSAPIEEVIRSQISELSIYESGFETRSLNSVGVNYDFDLPSEKQLLAAVNTTPLNVAGPYQGSLLDSLIKDWTPRNIDRVNRAIRFGFAQGKTTGSLVRDMSAVDGAFSASQKDLYNVVRTGLAHTANVSREATWRANSDIVKKYKISATIDTKTTSTCRSLDGKEYPLNKGPMPPFHINCRTTTVAALDDRFKVLGEGGTRSARDPETGEVISIPANETYYSFLKRQPASVQDSIIGPTRGKLMRNGGLSSDRFAELQIGKRFEPLTLGEMRKLEPIAFKKAGL